MCSPQATLGFSFFKKNAPQNSNGDGVTSEFSSSNDEEFWFKMGNMASQNGGYKFAQLCYEKATEINPEDPRYWEKLGAAYFSQDNFELSEKYFKRALSIDNNRPFSRLALGGLYLRQKNFVKAQNIYKSVWDLPGINGMYKAEAGLRLAKFRLSIRRQLLKTVEIIEKSIEVILSLFPESSNIEKKPEISEAFDILYSLLGEAYALYSIALIRLGGIDKANEFANNAQIIAPNDHAVSRLLEQKEKEESELNKSLL